MSTDQMSNTELNKAKVRELLAAFAANDPAVMDGLLAPGFTAHGLPPELGAGADALRGCMAAMHAGLQDCSNRVEDLIAEGDRVALRYTTRGRHGGELFGVPASGRTVTMTGIEIYRLVGDRVVEYWGEANMSELFAAGEQD